MPTGFPPEQRKAIKRSNTQTMMRCRSTPRLGSASPVPSEWLHDTDGSPLLLVTSTVVKDGLSEPSRRDERSSKHGCKHVCGSGCHAGHNGNLPTNSGSLWYNSGNLRFQLGGQLAMQETVQETRGLRSSYLASLERSASAVDGLRSSYLVSLEKGAPAVDLSV